MSFLMCFNVVYIFGYRVDYLAYTLFYPGSVRINLVVNAKPTFILSLLFYKTLGLIIV